MNVELYRYAGFFGRGVPIDVLVDGQFVASIKAGQALSLSVSDNGAALQVSMQGTVFSPIVRVIPDGHHQRFECGTPLWVFFDFLSLCYLSALKQRTFYLRRVLNA